MQIEPQRTPRTEREELQPDGVWIDSDLEPDPRLNGITNEIIGACLAVHKTLYCGYQELVYANALEIAMRRRGLRFERERQFDIRYEGEVVGKGRVDFLVESLVVVELKAVEAILPLHTAQVISYLKALDCPLGLLVNFNVRRLVDGIRRIAR